MFALRVQRPFHSYDDSVYSEVERLQPVPQSLFIEPSHRQQQNRSTAMLLTEGTETEALEKNGPDVLMNLAPLSSTSFSR